MIQYFPVQDISKLPKNVKTRLAKLSLGAKGIMSRLVTSGYNQNPAVLAIDMKKRKIAGWTTFMDGEMVRRIHGDTQQLDVFTDPTYRGQGIAKTLVQKAAVEAKARGIKKFKIHPHDKASAGLYGSLGAKYAPLPPEENPVGLSKAEKEAKKRQHMRSQGARKPGTTVSPTHFPKKGTKAVARLPVTALTKKVRNPETGNDITVKTALGYPKLHPAHQAARSQLRKEIIQLRNETEKNND